MSEPNSKIRSYDPKTSVVFLKTTEKFGGLSNMAAGYPLEVNGITIRTSEALYQALRFPHMPDLQRTIIDEVSPMTAKMRTKPHRGNSREDWDRVRVKIMRWCLQVKLVQNLDKFSSLLLSTGEAPIVEYSKKDQFWGAEPTEDGRLVGMNVLGRLLMELREQLQTKGADWFSRVEPLPIDHFELLRQHIGPVVSRRGAPTDAARSPVPPRDLFSAPVPEPSKQVEAEMAPSLADLRPYPDMKDTGLAWLPHIPAHWEMWRNGRLFGARRETGFPDLPILEVSLRSGVRVRDMESGRKQQMADRSKYLRAKKGDIAYNMMRMWQGAVGVVPEDGLVSPAYVVATPFPEADARYYAYLFRTAAYMGEADAHSRGIVKDRNRLYWESFKQIFSAVPPIDEQQLIVRFLDWHGSLTAKLIRAQRQLIALLSEQQHTIIRHAITRGVSRTSQFTASNEPWLGDVPAEWQVMPLKRLVRLMSGTSITANDIEAEGPYPVYGGNGRRGYTRTFNHDGEFLLVGRQGALCGNVRRASGQFFASEHALVAWVRRDLCLDWLEYLLVAMDLNQYSIAAAQPGLSVERIETVRVPVPSVAAQVDIARYIRDAIRPNALTASAAQREIGLVREFHARLIAGAVTGQIDVRAVARDLPEVGLQNIDDDVGEETDDDGAFVEDAA